MLVPMGSSQPFLLKSNNLIGPISTAVGSFWCTFLGGGGYFLIKVLTFSYPCLKILLDFISKKKNKLRLSSAKLRLSYAGWIKPFSLISSMID
jgi:hypothetical protein